MAQVNAKVLGGSIAEKTAENVGDLKRQMGLTGYSASVNGRAAEDSQELVNEDFVSFAPAVKGGM